MLHTMHGSVVLVVEDDHDMRALVRLALAEDGHRVVEAATGKQALAIFREAPPDLMILDLGLPDIDGIDVTLRVRHQHEQPIIVLSASDDEAQQVRALDAGANDYITKPFRERELMARVRCALRYAQRQPPSQELVVGELRMDVDEHRVFVKDEEIHLSTTELKLLHTLLSQAGRVVTHQRLLSDVWGPGGGEVQYLRVYMRQLRAKIEASPAHPKHLLTVLGVGYRFQP